MFKANGTNPTRSHIFKDPWRDSQDNRIMISTFNKAREFANYNVTKQKKNISALKLPDFVKLDLWKEMKKENRKKKGVDSVMERQ